VIFGGISAHPADGSQSDSRDILKSPCENAAERLLSQRRQNMSAAVAALAGSGHDNPLRKIVQLRRQGWRTVQSRQRYLGEFA
jgi:hypothetical protein